MQTSIRNIRRSIQTEVFTFQQVIDCLRDYAKPRDKIRTMVRRGEIIRIKKGLYVFGEDFRRGPWSREVLANLIYGPSYISLDSALSHHGLIPERVDVMTSVTLSRTREFDTPLGIFSYRSLTRQKYDVGIDQLRLGTGEHFLIATPAKALADKVWTDSRFTPRKPEDFRDYLDHDLRIDPAVLMDLDLEHLGSISDRYGSRKIRLLLDYLSAKEGTSV